MGLVVRPTVASDTPAVEALCKILYQSEPGVSVLLETALLNVTAIDTDQDTVVGYLCLQDVPTVRFGSSASAEALLAKPAAASSPSSTAFIAVAALMPELEVEVSLALLRGALAVTPSIRRFLLATDRDLTFSEPGLAALFSRLPGGGEAGSLLFQADKASVLPALTIRAAAIEDHDDMLPVLERAGARFPALAKLPESSNPEEAFALTRVVSGQDANNLVLVAHVPEEGRGGAGPGAAGAGDAAPRMVGFVVVTSEVDTSALMDAFDLHPYDNFLPVEEYDRQFEHARDSVRVKKTNTLEAKLGSRVKGGVAQDAQVQATEEEEGPAAAGEGVASEEGATAVGVGTGTEGEEEQIDISAAAEPTEEETKAEMAAIFGGQPTDVEPTMFAITMACVDEDYEGQTLEFIRQAFQVFPNKLYCVLTLPHDSPEPPLVGPFTRLTPLPGSMFPEVLYLFNRHALIEDFEVRMGAAGDSEGVSMLVSGMPNALDIRQLFEAAAERGTAVVAEVSGEVVGLVTISPKVDVTLLEANFSVSDLLYLPHHAPEAHGEIDMFCMNPIFAHRARELLSGAHRLLGKHALYYALPPGQAPPDLLDILVQVPPRHRPVASGLEAEFALYLFSRRHAFGARRGVNAQVVVVGASEAGLAAVERLLLDPGLSFNYITLLAPGGISVGGTACQYTAGVIAKLGLDARVTLLDAEMVGLDREARVVELSDGSQLAYDVLLVTSGMQEQTCNTHAETDIDVAGAVLSALELAADFSVGDAAAMERIVVYGHTLDSYHALSTLEARGAANKLQFITPHEEELNPLVRVLRGMAAQLQITLPNPMPAVLTNLNSVPGDARPVAVFEGGEGIEKGQVDLIVGCTPHEVSRIVFLCLNNAGVVFDGRVVVDGGFRTSDPHIYAAGSVARLSRRYGKEVLFQHYNSKEVGAALGASVVASFQAQAGAESYVSSDPPELGLGSSKVVGCSVPGGYTFEWAGTPTAMAAPSLDAPPGGRVMSTNTERGFFHLSLTAHSTVHAVAYLGRFPIAIHKLACLPGLHMEYLGGVVAGVTSGEIRDLVTALTSDAMELVYHDQFAAFRNKLLSSSIDTVLAGTPVGQMLGDGQEATLEFVRSHITELAAFSLPATA